MWGSATRDARARDNRESEKTPLVRPDSNQAPSSGGTMVDDPNATSPEGPDGESHEEELSRKEEPPRTSTRRGSFANSLLRAAAARFFHRPEAKAAAPRERAATAVRPLDDPFMALEKRSSLGYEGLPEMPRGRLRESESVEWDPDIGRWQQAHRQASGRSDIFGPSMDIEQKALGSSRRRQRWAEEIDEDDALTRAVTFLEDALGYRDPHYNSDISVIPSYRLRQSRGWNACKAAAVLAYIASCFLGKPPFSANWKDMPTPSPMQGPIGQTWGLCLEIGCVLFFSCDIYLLHRCTNTRSLLTCWWKAAFLLSLLLSVVDMSTRWYTTRPWSRVFRPAVFFFVSPKVRDCSLSTLHAVGALLPVLLLELLVTLAYACVCVVLYHGVSEAPFTTLQDAFLSLFSLSTTVNDPDVWMPLYHRNRANVLVFSSFLVVQVFLLHNILLASVWNEFGERMKTYAKKKRKWREQSIRRAFEALDFTGAGYLSQDMVMTLLRKIRSHYDGSKRMMMYERIVHSVRGGKSGKQYDPGEVTQVHRRDFCDNVVEALSLKIRTMRDWKIARAGQYMLLPLYVWNMAFVVVSCAMSPWVFNTSTFWFALLPTSLFLGASVLVEIVMTGVRAYIVLPWNRVKTLSLVLTVTGLLWVVIFSRSTEWGHAFAQGKVDKLRSVHMQVSIALLMSARCMDLGSLLKLVPAIHDVVSIMYNITPSVFAQAGVIFTIFHVYTYLGMALYGGVITPSADYGETPFAYSPYYYDNNFNSYPEGLVTLFELLIVNNWNMIITGYIHASPLKQWAYMYFLSFITLAVALALNVLTAIFMTAFTATTIKANMPAVRSAGGLSQSMTSDVARTALGAGASLALRPTMASYVNSTSEHGSSGDYSPSRGGRRRFGDKDDDTDSIITHAGDDSRGGQTPSGPGAWMKKQSSRVDSELGGSGTSGGGGSSASGKGIRGDAPSAEVLSALSSVRFPDPLRSRLSATAVLPEHEAVEEVGDDAPGLDSRETRQDSYLGWGTGSDEAGAMPPPPPPGSGPGRTRWGSGHYYKVSRRNSYSDKDMFEAAKIEDVEEEAVAGSVLGAIAIGLGNSIGIRACMLRHREARIGSIRRLASPRSGGDSDVRWEDEVQPPESNTIYENSAFRHMVEPHLPGSHATSVRLGGSQEEGWEAMAMRDELTDAMLHSVFGDAITAECPPPPQSPVAGTSRSGFPMTPASTRSGSERAPPSPSEKERTWKASSTGEDDLDEEDDADLPKDLGVRVWSKTLDEEDRGKRRGSNKTVLSVQCVLAMRTPVPVVVYTSKILQ